MTFSRAQPVVAAAALLCGTLACGTQTLVGAALVEIPGMKSPAPGFPDVPPQTTLVAYMATADASNPAQIDASKVAPVLDATGSLAYHSASLDKDFDLGLYDRGDGQYGLDSPHEQRLSYEPGQPYTLVLTDPNGVAYGVQVTPGPRVGIREARHAQATVTGVNQDFTVTRDDGPEPDGRLLPIFVTVAWLDPAHPAATPAVIFSTVPQTASALAKFAVSDAGWRVPGVTIPGSVFSSRGYYVVALLKANYGLVSDNLFFGSTIVAASGEARVLQVR